MFRAAAIARIRKQQQNEERKERAKLAKAGLLERKEGFSGFSEEDARRRASRGSGYDSEDDADDDAPFNLEDGFRMKIMEVLRRKEKAVYFKDHHGRFPGQYTLKLRKEGKYKVSLEVDKRMNVEYVKLGGILWDEFEEEPPNSDDKVGHVFTWDTDKMELIGAHYRLVFPCVVKLEEEEEFGFDFMLKFYDKEQKQYSTGDTLSHLSLDCSESELRQGNLNVYKLNFHTNQVKV